MSLLPRRLKIAAAAIGVATMTHKALCRRAGDAQGSVLPTRRFRDNLLAPNGASSLGRDAAVEGFGSDETGPPIQMNFAPAVEPAMSTVCDMHLG